MCCGVPWVGGRLRCAEAEERAQQSEEQGRQQQARVEALEKQVAAHRQEVDEKVSPRCTPRTPRKGLSRGGVHNAVQ